jgi:hypothetical protein
MIKQNRIFSIVRVLLVFILFLTALHQTPFSHAKEFHSPTESYKSIINLFDGELAYETVNELCKDKYEGRQSGTEAGLKSAQWIASKFQEYGLEPYSENSYLQTFNIPFFNYSIPTSLSFFNSTSWSQSSYKEDYVVFPGSGSNHIKGEVVFVGQGMISEDKQFDEYKGVDCQGKIVLIADERYYEPIMPTEEYLTNRYKYKIQHALDHGAIGLIFISHPQSYSILLELVMEKKVYSMSDNIPDDFPIVYIIEDVFDEHFAREESYKSLIQRNYEFHEVVSFETGVIAQIETTTDGADKEAHNVIGFIPSAKKETEKSIIIGAHYDHLGKIAISNEIYPGANKNASGVAVMIEIVRILSQSPVVSQYHIVFIAFASGEAKALGARNYVNHPLFPINQVELMLNLEQVGSDINPSWFALTNLHNFHNNFVDPLDQLCFERLSHDYEIVDLYSNWWYPMDIGFDTDPFACHEVPFVTFRNYDMAYVACHHHRVSDTPEVVSPWILQEIGQVVVGFLLHCGDFSIFHIPDLENNTRFQHPVILLSGFHKGMIEQVAWGRFGGALMEVI